MLYIVVFDNEVKGVFTAPSDAVNYCKKFDPPMNKYYRIFKCHANSEEVSILNE